MARTITPMAQALQGRAAAFSGGAGPAAPKKKKKKSLPSDATHGLPIDPDNAPKHLKDKTKAEREAAKKARKTRRYLKSDEGFQQDRADIRANYANFRANQKTEKSRYDQDYADALRNLGYVDGGFDESNRLGAYGQAIASQGGDFAARGNRESSFYLDALSDTQGSFNRQLGDMAADKQRAADDRALARQQAKGERDRAIQRARQEALLRMAAEQGLVAP